MKASVSWAGRLCTKTVDKEEHGMEGYAAPVWSPDSCDWGKAPEEAFDLAFPLGSSHEYLVSSLLFSHNIPGSGYGANIELFPVAQAGMKKLCFAVDGVCCVWWLLNTAVVQLSRDTSGGLWMTRVCCCVGYRYTQFHVDANTVFSLFTCSEIASVLRAWLDQCSEDFREPPDYMCLLKLLDYLKNNMPNSDMESRVQNLLKQFQNQEVEAVGELPFPSLFLSSQTVRCPRDLCPVHFTPLMLINNIVRLTSGFCSGFFFCLFFERKPNLCVRLQALWGMK